MTSVSNYTKSNTCIGAIGRAFNFMNIQGSTALLELRSSTSTSYSINPCIWRSRAGHNPQTFPPRLMTKVA